MTNHPKRNQGVIAIVDCLNQMDVGDEGVLVSRSPERGPSEWFLYPTPPLTNMSREPRVQGWCGTTDGISVTAHGWHRIVKVLGWTDKGQRLVRVVPS